MTERTYRAVSSCTLWCVAQRASSCGKTVVYSAHFYTGKRVPVIVCIVVLIHFSKLDPVRHDFRYHQMNDRRLHPPLTEFSPSLLCARALMPRSISRTGRNPE